MSSYRIRIFSSLLIAFIIVSVYGNLTEIKTLFSNLKFPTINLTKSSNNLADKQFINQNNSFSLTPIPQSLPITSNQLNPSPSPTGSRGLINQTPTSIKTIPTNTPKPTKAPKPTKVPPLPSITSDTRPGTNLTEIFQEVNKRACIPVALLMAFKTEETGESFKNANATTIKIYNTYGWWQSGTGDPCYGEGYAAQTGIVPQDSVGAETVCQNPIPSGADQQIMGILQISQEEENAAKKYVTSIIKGNIDRRVLFDNAIIFAIITKNRLGTPPSNCNDWPSDAIKTAAEKHYGSCYISATRNYCNEILQYYRQYK